MDSTIQHQQNNAEFPKSIYYDPAAFDQSNLVDSTGTTVDVVLDAANTTNAVGRVRGRGAKKVKWYERWEYFVGMACGLVQMYTILVGNGDFKILMKSARDNWLTIITPVALALIYMHALSKYTRPMVYSVVVGFPFLCIASAVYLLRWHYSDTKMLVTGALLLLIGGVSIIKMTFKGSREQVDSTVKILEVLFTVVVQKSGSTMLLTIICVYFITISYLMITKSTLSTTSIFNLLSMLWGVSTFETINRLLIAEMILKNKKTEDYEKEESAKNYYVDTLVRCCAVGLIRMMSRVLMIAYSVLDFITVVPVLSWIVKYLITRLNNWQMSLVKFSDMTIYYGVIKGPEEAGLYKHGKQLTRMFRRNLISCLLNEHQSTIAVLTWGLLFSSLILNLGLFSSSSLISIVSCALSSTLAMGGVQALMDAGLLLYAKDLNENVVTDHDLHQAYSYRLSIVRGANVTADYSRV